MTSQTLNYVTLFTFQRVCGFRFVALLLHVTYVLDFPAGDVIIVVGHRARDLAEEGLEPLVVLQLLEARLPLVVVL